MAEDKMDEKIKKNLFTESNNDKNKEDSFMKIKFALIILGTVIGVYLIFRWILPLVLPFIFSYFLVLIIMPIVMFLNKRLRIPKSIGASITLVFMVGIILFIINKIGCKLLEQAKLFIKNIPVYQNAISNFVDGMCNHCEKSFGLTDGSMKDTVNSSINDMMVRLQSNFMPTVTERTIRIFLTCVGIITILIIIIMSAILIIQDIDSMKKEYHRFLFYDELHELTSKLSFAGIAYLRSQGILMVITAAICTVGLIIMKSNYALLIGIGISIFDAFPVLGSGFILVPWAIIMVVSKNIFAAAILMSMYLLCQLVRQFLEPKLLGNRIGVKPIFTIMAMYVGVRLFHIVGFIVGPIALVVIITIIKTLCPAIVKEKRDD